MRSRQMLTPMQPYPYPQNYFNGMFFSSIFLVIYPIRSDLDAHGERETTKF
jgi:hypothetical protein